MPSWPLKTLAAAAAEDLLFFFRFCSRLCPCTWSSNAPVNGKPHLCAQQWVRTRCRQAGLPRLSSVHLVSSVKGTGIPAMLEGLAAAAGTRGDVWVVGAQVWCLVVPVYLAFRLHRAAL